MEYIKKQLERIAVTMALQINSIELKKEKFGMVS